MGSSRIVLCSVKPLEVTSQDKEMLAVTMVVEDILPPMVPVEAAASAKQVNREAIVSVDMVVMDIISLHYLVQV